MFWEPIAAYAAPKQAEIVTTDKIKDLVVMFTFDKELVDIVFISPSGQRFSASDDSVEYSYGDLWSTYRIKDAEAGTWKVEYDLKSNSGIDYSIIEDDAGIWIQYLTIQEQTSEALKLSFQADYEAEEINYNYVITAINMDDNEKSELYNGGANSGEEKVIDVPMKALSSGKYKIQLEVYYSNNLSEIFDTMTTDAIEYINPSVAEAIGEYKITLDSSNLNCNVDWKDIANWRYNEYNLSVKADGLEIYSSKLDRSSTSVNIVYPDTTSNLDIELSYNADGLWSKAHKRSISLNNEYLKILSSDISNSGQVIIEYLSSMERELLVRVNDEEGTYIISGTGSLSFDLSEGINKIYARFVTNDSVYYILNKDIFYDAYPPTIDLYEHIDGKKINDNKFDILGKIDGGIKLLVNGNEQPLDESGEFCATVELISGENIITLEAIDANGNSTVMTIMLYKEALIKNIGINQWIKRLLPFLISLIVSVLLIIAALIFMKNKDKNEKDKSKKVSHIIYLVILGLFDLACLSGVIYLNMYLKSLDFLELSEKSISSAVQMIKLYNVLKNITVVGTIAFVLYLIIILLINKGKNKASTKEQKSNPVLVNEVQEEQKNFKFCSKCGKKLALEARFCTGCGTQFEISSNEESEEQDNNEKVNCKSNFHFAQLISTLN
jgi:ribosomal protein L40E